MNLHKFQFRLRLYRVYRYLNLSRVIVYLSIESEWESWAYIMVYIFGWDEIKLGTICVVYIEG